jgi:NADH-quinone oxidoreductase subunit C
MSTTEEVAEEAVAAPDAVREAVARAFADHLGAGFLDQHIVAGRDMWIRIDKSSWVDAARFARDKLGMTWIDFVSAIDWMPSPFGRDMEAEQDWVVHGRDIKDAEAQTTGVAGGDTRFQVMMRLYSTDEHIGVTIKADLPDNDLAIDTIIPVFPGANWHERELWEMFGIDIIGHPDLRALYLPSEFEGNPMRKDYPLVSRRVKPWPGIVDVEAMPNEGDEADEADNDAADADGEG